MSETLEDGSTLRTITHAGLPNMVAYTRSFPNGVEYVIVLDRNVIHTNPQWLQMPTYEASLAYVKTTLEALYQQSTTRVGSVPMNGQAPPLTKAEQEQRERAEKLKRKAQERAAKRHEAWERNVEWGEKRKAERQYRKERDKNKRKAYSIPCPVCPSSPGRNCVSPSGNSLPEPHVARLEMVTR